MDYYCPVCMAESPEYIYLDNGKPVGCDECIERVDAYEYMREVLEDARMDG